MKPSTEKVMGHTEGKVMYQERSDEYTHIIRDLSGKYIVSTPQDDSGTAEANARRLVACWNYCILIKTENIEARIGPLLSRTINPLIKKMDEGDALINELVEALKECQLAIEPYNDVKPRAWKTDREKLAAAHQTVRAALARYEELEKA